MIVYTLTMQDAATGGSWIEETPGLAIFATSYELVII